MLYFKSNATADIHKQCTIKHNLAADINGRVGARAKRTMMLPRATMMVPRATMMVPCAYHSLFVVIT